MNEEQTIPGMSEVAVRLGALRQQQQLSMRQLAERAGVAASYISAVERGKISPTIAQLSRVLVALGTDLATFFTTPTVAPTGYVFRQQAMEAAADAGRRYTFVFPKRDDIKLEVLVEELMPGDLPEFEQLAVDLAGYVLEGELLLEVQEAEAETLIPGDAFYLPANHPVRGRCAGPTPVRLITMMTPPRY